MFGLQKQYARHDKRYTAPTLHLKVGDSTFDTVDWSHGGLRFKGRELRFTKGKTVVIGEVTPELDKPVRTFIQGSVAWSSFLRGEVGVRFTELGESGEILMARLQRGGRRTAGFGRAK